MPFHSASGILGEPLIIKFIHHQDAILIAEFQKVLTIGIMKGADMVHAEFLRHLSILIIECHLGSI